MGKSTDKRKIASPKDFIRQREVDKRLWAKIQEKLEGTKQERREAVELLFSEHWKLPRESKDLIINLSSPNNPLYVRAKVIRCLLKYKSLPLQLHLEILKRMKQDPNDRVRKEAEKGYEEWTTMASEQVKAVLNWTKRLSSQLAVPPVLTETMKYMETLNDYYKRLASPKLPSFVISGQNTIMWKDISEALNRTIQFQAPSFYPFEELDVVSVPAEVEEGTTAEELAKRLEACPPGRTDWRRYEIVVKDVLTYAFVPPLMEPEEQQCTARGIQRRDLIFHVPHGVSRFWDWVDIRYGCLALIVECKNFSAPVPSNEVTVASKYFGETRLGKFGLIVSRNGLDENGYSEQRRLWTDDRKLILSLTDADLRKILEIKEQGDDPSKVVDRAILDFHKSID